MAKQKNFNTFEQWTSIDVSGKLHVFQQSLPDALQNWIPQSGVVPESVQTILQTLREELNIFNSFWNEQELFGKFIAPLMNTIPWRDQQTNLFHNRPLRAEIKQFKVHGMVDGMVASGLTEPSHPYFFLHEYKRMKQSEADPLGQLLIAMIAARELNLDGKPIYGCYIIGRYWTFVLLDGDTYAQTQGYDATDSGELQTIWLILEKTKQIIIQRVAEELQINS